MPEHPLIEKITMTENIIKTGLSILIKFKVHLLS
jgi:hypothetical protein